MVRSWNAEHLAAIGSARELEIATVRPDGTLHPWQPIWVVAVDEQVYIRTWKRRDSGWFGRAVRSGCARIRVPGLEADVAVGDVGDTDAALRSEVDEAYRAKYGDGGSTVRMTGEEAAASTLRLSPAAPDDL